MTLIRVRDSARKQADPQAKKVRETSSTEMFLKEEISSANQP